MHYFLSLGSNVNPESNIELAIIELTKILEELRCSSTIKTKAEGFEGKDFLNLVVAGYSNLGFDEFNQLLKTIEDLADRDRTQPKFSNRTLDIDIVLQLDSEEEILYESDEVQKYTFVSEPLSELL